MLCKLPSSGGWFAVWDMSPLLGVDNDIDIYGTEFLEENILAPENTLVHLTFADPVPRKPDMVDHLDLDGRQVFSKKVYDVLKDKNIFVTQLVPVVIKDRNGENTYTDYWVFNLLNEYAFLDKKGSKYDGTTSDGGWLMLENLAFDFEKMEQVLLEERLVYDCSENTSYVLYHKSIVDIIISVKSTGIVFVPVEEWQLCM